MELTVSMSPHIRGKNTIEAMMLTFIVGLAPTCLAGIYLFGMRALVIIALSVATFLTWAAAVLSLGVIAFSGWFIKARVGTTLWNYALGLMPLGALALECVLFGLVFSALKRWFSRQERQVNVQDKDILEVSQL